MTEPAGVIRPVGDDSHDWCFDCWVCGTNVRAQGTRFPAGTTPVSVQIGGRGSMPVVDSKLMCSEVCAVSMKAKAWKDQRSAEPDAQQAARQAAQDRAARKKDRGSRFYSL